MSSSSFISQKKIQTFFFEDMLAKIQTQKSELISSIQTKQRTIPFFKQKSTQSQALTIPERKSENLTAIIPSEAINTSDPTINTREFALKNLRIALENEFMVLQLIRQLCEIENYLLYLLVEKQNTLQEQDIDLFLNTVKERLILFRDPVNQKLYKKFDLFNTEFDVTLKYLQENRGL